MSFDGASPPDYRQECAQIGLRLTVCHLMDAQRNQCGCVPKRRHLAHSPSARSSSSAWVPSLFATLPVGIRSSSSILIEFFGSLSLPAATSNSSSSLASSAENGTSFATGKLLSRITISSPALPKVRYLLNWFFNSATLTLRMHPLLMAIIAMKPECTQERVGGLRLYWRTRSASSKVAESS